MSNYNIAVIVGSLRQDSLNRKLAQALAKQAPENVKLQLIEIGDLPLYNQDDDANPAPSAQRLRKQILEADGVIFVTPEYNRSVPGVLKNAIDHGSRPAGKSVWKGKPAGVIGVSPGAIGTALAQQHLRNILAFLDMPSLCAPEAFLQAKEGFFDENGDIGPQSRDFVLGWLNHFIALVAAHTKRP